MTALLQRAIGGGKKAQLGLLLGAMLAAALLVPSGLTALAAVSPPVQTFVDVPPDHQFYVDIEWMAAEGISEGYEPGPEYRPSIAVSRGAMSAFMYRLAESPPFASPITPTFADVGTGHPFYDEIEWMAATEITTGFATTPPTYQPGAAVSRQSMSAFMYRLAGSPGFVDPGTPTFTDVGGGHPFYSEIEWMAETEISEGYTPGPEYRPSIAVSRQAMSAFMHRLADGPGVDI